MEEMKVLLKERVSIRASTDPAAKVRDVRAVLANAWALMVWTVAGMWTD